MKTRLFVGRLNLSASPNVRHCSVLLLRRPRYSDLIRRAPCSGSCVERVRREPRHASAFYACPSESLVGRSEWLLPVAGPSVRSRTDARAVIWQAITATYVSIHRNRGSDEWKLEIWLQRSIRNP